jgi:hypothetical protein
VEDFTGMPSEDKLSVTFKPWLCPDGIQFLEAEAEESYKARVNRILNAILLTVPDRIPVIPSIGFFPAYFAGISPYEAMYDYAKLCLAWKKYITHFRPDMFSGLGNPSPGKVFELLDYKMYRWPGHGVSADASYQCVEGEYMKADEPCLEMFVRWSNLPKSMEDIRNMYCMGLYNRKRKYFYDKDQIF